MEFKQVYLQYNGSTMKAYDLETDELIISNVTPFEVFKYQDTLGFIEYNHHSYTYWKFVSSNGAKIRKTITNNFELELLVNS